MLDDVHSKINAVLGCLQKRMIITKLGLLSLLLERVSGLNLQILQPHTDEVAGKNLLICLSEHPC